MGNKLGQVTGVVQQVTARVEEMMTVQARVQSLEQHQANLMALVESLVPLLGRVQTMEHQVTNVNQGIKQVMGDLRKVEGRLISQVEQAKEFMGHKINQDIGLLGEHLSKLEKLVIKHETGMGRGLGENVMRPPPGPSTTAMTLGQGGASQGCTLGTRELFPSLPGNYDDPGRISPGQLEGSSVMEHTTRAPPSMMDWIPPSGPNSNTLQGPQGVHTTVEQAPAHVQPPLNWVDSLGPELKTSRGSQGIPTTVEHAQAPVQHTLNWAPPLGPLYNHNGASHVNRGIQPQIGPNYGSQSGPLPSGMVNPPQVAVVTPVNLLPSWAGPLVQRQPIWPIR